MDGGCSPRATCSAVPAGIVTVISRGPRAVSRKKRNGASLISAPINRPSAIARRILLITKFLGYICFFQYTDAGATGYGSVEVVPRKLAGFEKWNTPAATARMKRNNAKPTQSIFLTIMLPDYQQIAYKLALLSAFLYPTIGAACNRPPRSKMPQLSLRIPADGHFMTVPIKYKAG